jgi:hydrogenase assembly chaperone HypC/HupF
MCVSYPALVVSVESDLALVEIGGQRLRASLALEPGISPGDWVVVAAGTIIERLEPSEAKEVRRLLDLATRPE